MNAKSISVTLACAGCLWLVSGCASPLAGKWQGTADIGPIAAFDLQFEVDSEDQPGTIAVREPGRPEHMRICHIDRQGRAITIEYDVGRPNCDASGPTPADRRVLKGTIGEGIVTGEVWKGGDKIGFFRAFVATSGPQAKQL